jgi:hypothetical protein
MKILWYFLAVATLLFAIAVFAGYTFPPVVVGMHILVLALQYFRRAEEE